jgi:lysophospholipid acyltransferase (LPLAT)-like uncharacterized protein
MKKKLRDLWKRFWKKVQSFRAVQWLLGLLMAAGIWFAFLTSRHKVRNKKLFREYKKKPAIFVFWHGRSMMLSAINATYGIKGYAVSSRHRDGRMMAKLQRLFGLKPIYGSTTEGAVSVLRQGLQRLNEGHRIALSPDGPKGPRMRLNNGALYFAKMSGAPIIPVCYSSSKPWFQKRKWDMYLVALPFSKIICEIGEPFFIDRKATEADIAAAHDKLEKIMIEQQQKLDAEFGLPKIEPQPEKR